MGSVSHYTGNGIGAKASADVLAHRIVKLTNTDQIRTVAPPSSNAGLFGIAAEAAASGNHVAVFTNGLGRLTVNGNSVNIAAGDKLKSTGSAGIGVKAATDKDEYIAIALEPATADGVEIDVLIIHGFLAA